MKTSRFLVLFVMAICLSLLSCNNDETTDLDNNIVETEQTEIFIDGKSYEMTFNRSSDDEITIDETNELIIDNFAKENENMSFYVDKN